jgi:EF-P beta-lysylation protein EpmB
MTPSWQSELADSFTDPVALLRFLGLATDNFDPIAATSHFPFRVTKAYAERIRKGDFNDPLLRQVLPDIAEKLEAAGFNSDPVGDLSSVSHPGVLHKYQGRALLVTTGACAIHCRYCFRREFPYEGQQLVKSRELAALESIGEDPSIQEVILSGGDPLVLSNQRLAGLVSSINRIPHVRRLRIHSRLPIVLPSRVDSELLALFGTARLRVVMVIHANHPHELDGPVGQAILAMTRLGMTVLNQSVLLRGINDSADSLVELSEKLFESGALPYYLHLLDRVTGTAHFEVPEGQARQLMDELRKQLPGYLVPKLVREIPGAPYKQPV